MFFFSLSNLIHIYVTFVADEVKFEKNIYFFRRG